MGRSREAILAALGGRTPQPGDLSRATGPRLAFADRMAAFEDNIVAAGGTCVRVEPGGLEPRIAELCAPHAPDRLLCTVGERRAAAARSLPESALPELQLAVLRGGPAVAESGAVWWSPDGERERAAGFLAQSVVLVVSPHAVVDNLHEAYERVDPAGMPFGCFVSGPSKTADIEQALVIGAHGPRALTVLLSEDLER